LNGNYESSKVIAQGYLHPSWWLDLALRKNFLKNKATLILNCSDIFKSRVFVTDYNLSSYYETINRVKETRIGNVTFTYRFGKSDLKQGGGKRGMKDDKPKQVNPDVKDRENNLKDGEDGDQGGPGGGGGGQRPGGGGKN
jgi:uncharacterized membrane protein YgcG